ncbi:NAD(P)H-hydrate dehydratase [Dellaglioa sp. L3N]
MEKITKSVITTIFQPKLSQNNIQKIVIVGGNENGGGSVFMTAKAAFYSSGMPITTATDKLNLGALYANLPETDFVNYFDKVQLANTLSKAAVIVAGPGLGSDLRSSDILDVVLANVSINQTLILSGAALKIIKESHKSLPETDLILVADETEWADFADIPVIQQTPETIKAIQENLNATIVLKKTYIELYSKDGTIQVDSLQTTQTSTNSLTGLIAGLIALIAALPETIAAAIYLHSYIESQIAHSEFPVLPSRLIEKIPEFIHEFKA